MIMHVALLTQFQNSKTAWNTTTMYNERIHRKTITTQLSLRSFYRLTKRYRTIRKLSYCRDSAGQRSLCRSKSFKGTDFGTNQKPVRDFLLLNNTNLPVHPISHPLPDIAQYWSIYCFRQRVAVYNECVLTNLLRTYRHHWDTAKN